MRTFENTLYVRTMTASRREYIFDVILGCLASFASPEQRTVHLKEILSIPKMVSFV